MDSQAQLIIDKIQEHEREYGPFPKKLSKPLGVKLEISDLDPDGERGGTEYLVNHCFKYRVTQGRESYLEESLKPLSIIESNMVRRIAKT